MRVELEGGEGHVSVIHGETVIEWKHQEYEVRVTMIRVQLPDGRLLEARAVCSPLDHFVKKIGRSIATRNLAKVLRDENLSRQDREAILRPIWRVFR